MTVKLTSEAERERIAARPAKPTWEHLRTVSIVEAVHAAKKLGWAEKKVQVRAELVASDTYEYVVEPFERNCGCSSLLKYSDIFETDSDSNVK